MLTCAEGSTDELKVYIHTPAFARPQCQTSSPKPLDQSNPNFVWNLHGHGATGVGGGEGGETMFAESRSLSTEPMTQAIIVCSNYYPGLTLTCFMTRSNFVT